MERLKLKQSESQQDELILPTIKVSAIVLCLSLNVNVSGICTQSEMRRIHQNNHTLKRTTMQQQQQQHLTTYWITRR